MTTKRLLYLGLDPSHCPLDGEITHFPIIEVVPRPLSEVKAALLPFQKYTHVVITSKTAVSILRDYLALLNISISTWNEKLTLAVGAVTALYLREAGVKNMLVATDEKAEGVVALFDELSLTQEAYFFLPRSSLSRSVIPDELIKRGVRYRGCALYDTVTKREIPTIDLTLFDEIVFTSPSTVKAFWELFGAPPRGKRLTPIGPVTREALLKICQ